MNKKLMFILLGHAVPSLKISRISSRFRRMLLPQLSLIPRILASAKLWFNLLKYSATGKPGEFFSMLRRYSPKRSRRMRPVSPMYRAEHLRHEIQLNQVAGITTEMLFDVDRTLWTVNSKGLNVRIKTCFISFA